MFDLGSFVADCRSAVAVDPTHKGVAALMEQAISDPDAVLAEWDTHRGRGFPDLSLAGPDRHQRRLFM